jgi:hypothetical protein
MQSAGGQLPSSEGGNEAQRKKSEKDTGSPRLQQNAGGAAGSGSSLS